MVCAGIGLAVAITTGALLVLGAINVGDGTDTENNGTGGVVSSANYETKAEYVNRLYTDDITEDVHITGAIWGDGHFKTLNNLYQTGFVGDLKGNLTNASSLSYEIGMLEKPWQTYMNFNDKDELYRIDMTVSERIIGVEEDGSQLKFLADLLDELYSTYGLWNGYLFPTESTVDFGTAYRDLSTADNLDLFQTNDFLSVTYKRNEMAVWVVIQREDYDESRLSERAPDILLNNELPYILGEKESPGDYITTPNLTDKYQRSSGSLLAQNRDRLYTAYVGYLNTRFEPPEVKEMEIIDESDKWPQPVLDGDVYADPYRTDNDSYILENYKK